MCAADFERRMLTAWRRAARSSRLPSVISCSTNGRTSFAFASVVLIRPCSISATASLFCQHVAPELPTGPLVTH